MSQKQSRQQKESRNENKLTSEQTQSNNNTRIRVVNKAAFYALTK